MRKIVIEFGRQNSRTKILVEKFVKQKLDNKIQNIRLKAYFSLKTCTQNSENKTRIEKFTKQNLGEKICKNKSGWWYSEK